MKLELTLRVDPNAQPRFRRKELLARALAEMAVELITRNVLECGDGTVLFDRVEVDHKFTAGEDGVYGTRFGPRKP
jgi:hypothetical protein